MSAAGGFRIEERGDVWVSVLEGEIDVSNASELGEEIIDAVSNEPEGLVLDVSNVRYLDSSGIGLLFGLVRALEARRQRLVLVVPEGSPLTRLLAVTKLDSVIPVRESRTEAQIAARTSAPGRRGA